MEKEFGKLTLQQVKALAQMLLDLRKIKRELTRQAKRDEKEYLKNAPEEFSWAEFYSQSLQELLACVLFLGGMEGEVQQAVREQDPQQHILEMVNTFEPQLQDCGYGEKHSQYVFTVHLYALMKTLEAIEVYGCSLNRLMQRLRGGDNDALFAIVRLDHSAVGNPEVMRRISIAEFQDDKKFFSRLRNALKNRPLKQTAIYGPIRYILATFHELEVLDKLSIEDFYQLFCIELKLYPTSGKDPARSLKRLIDRWAKANATSSGDFMS